MEGGGYVIQISENINSEMFMLRVQEALWWGGRERSGALWSKPQPQYLQTMDLEMILKVSEPLLFKNTVSCIPFKLNYKVTNKNICTVVYEVLVTCICWFHLFGNPVQWEVLLWFSLYRWEKWTVESAGACPRSHTPAGGVCGIVVNQSLRLPPFRVLYCGSHAPGIIV